MCALRVLRILRVCDQQWRDDDSLIFIPGIRRGERDALDIGGVIIAGRPRRVGRRRGRNPPAAAALAGAAGRVAGSGRLAGGTELPHELIEVGDDARLGHGFEQMPLPDDGDVFLDFEGHPFWRPNTGLFFLFGLIERDEKGTWAYRDWWAHNIEEEAEAVVALIGHLTERRRHYPGMHAYHYNHTERSALQNLTSKHGAGEAALGLLIQAEVFVDLLTVARNAIQVGAESLQPEGGRAAHRLPAQPRHRQGCGSGRQPRELHGQRRRHRTPGHRGLQRGRRPRHGLCATGWSPNGRPICRGANQPANPTRSSSISPTWWHDSTPSPMARLSTY